MAVLNNSLAKSREKYIAYNRKERYYEKLHKNA